MNVLPVASVNPSLVSICYQVVVYVFKIYLYKMFTYIICKPSKRSKSM